MGRETDPYAFWPVIISINKFSFTILSQLTAESFNSKMRLLLAVCFE